MESRREGIWIIKLNKDDMQEGVPSADEDTISFQLSGEPDQYWITIFHNIWEQNLGHALIDFINVNVRFEGKTLYASIPKTLNIRWTEEKIREIITLANHCFIEELPVHNSSFPAKP